jgi:hypothetical protein
LVNINKEKAQSLALSRRQAALKKGKKAGPLKKPTFRAIKSERALNLRKVAPPKKVGLLRRTPVGLPKSHA